MAFTYEGGGATFTLSSDFIAIYAPQPLICFHPTANLGNITVEIVDKATQKSVTDTRTMRPLGTGGYGCTFDIAPMLRAIVPDIRELLNGLQPDVYYSPNNELSRIFELNIEDGTGNALINGECRAIYASLDWHDYIEGGDINGRRFYPNFPMTMSGALFDDWLSVWAGLEEIRIVVIDETEIKPVCNELPVSLILKNKVPSFIEDAIRTGQIDILISGVLWFKHGEWDDFDNGSREYIMRVDARERGQGVFLRWLNRDGSLGYWLLTRSKTANAVKADNSFTRYYLPDSSKPFAGHHVTMQDYTRTETWTLGATDLSEAEYNYLLGITTSPVVDMLDERDEWVPVNIVPATYTRNQPRSGLDRRRELEIQITLPERELIKL